jgi:hypothetical protein
MSSKIFRRHTRRQKKLTDGPLQQGSGWFSNPTPTPKIVNFQTGAFQFFDPLTSSLKVYDPNICGTRELNPTIDNLNTQVDPQVVTQLINNKTGDIQFVDPMTRNTRRYETITGITKQMDPTRGFVYMPICFPQNKSYGGKLRKRRLKSCKTRKGGKTRRCGKTH